MKKLIWATVLSVILLFVGLIYHSDRFDFWGGGDSSWETSDRYPSLAKVEFDDFRRMAVLDLTEGHLQERVSSSSGGLFVLQSGGRTTQGFRDGFEIETVTINGEVQNRNYAHSFAPGGLFMLLELSDFDRSLVAAVLKQEVGLVHLREGSDDLLPPSQSMQSGKLFNELPPLVVQLSDSAGGWHTALGPAAAGKATDQRLVVVFPAWPRSAKKLAFRAFVPGQPAESFSLPNPFVAVKPVPLKVAALPQSHREIDFELSLEAVELIPLPEHGELLSMEFDFESRFSGAAQIPVPWKRPMSVLPLTTLQNEWGHRTVLSHRLIGRRRSKGGFLIPSDGQNFRIEFGVERTSFFPRERGQVLIIAEAQVGVDGSRIELKSTRSGVGLTDFSFTSLVAKDGQQETVIEGKFQWSSKKKRSQLLGGPLSPSEGRFFLFKKGENWSTGGTWASSRSTRDGVGLFGERLEEKWLGELKPGQSFEIGIAPSYPIQFVSFEFDRAAILAQ